MAHHFLSAHAKVADEPFFRRLRKTEFGRLDQQKQVYLDYTGGNLYARSQVLQHQRLLFGNILGNPHSTNPSSQKSTHLVESARARILRFFNAKDYTCIFTQNASGALKIVGESYPFSAGSRFVLLSDNHNSVNGIREFCRSRGGRTQYAPLNYEDLQINEEALEGLLNEPRTASDNLFAYPAQSNVSGVKHDLKWIAYAQERGFDVLLDAAAFAPSSRLDLSQYHPEFVSLSFYKIFGYPTGIGCLLVKNSVFHKLVKPWFAGGTVTLVSVAAQNRFLADGHERFEDGTLNYADIPAVETGLDFIESIGMERITARVKALSTYLAGQLKALRHPDGRSVVKIFGPEGFENRGGNLIMSFFDAEGKVYPFDRIEALANAHSISIRSGCFCNPGVDEVNNCIGNEELAQYFRSRDNGDYRDMMRVLGKLRGATRVSVGLATTQQDLDAFVAMVVGLQGVSMDQG